MPLPDVAATVVAVVNARALCRACKGKILWLKIGSRRVAVDFPGRNTGNVAAYQSAETGIWFAWYAGPGQPVEPPYKRWQPHAETCPKAEPVPSISEPQRESQALAGADWRKAANQAQSARNAALRRPRPRVQPTAGYRKPPQ